MKEFWLVLEIVSLAICLSAIFALVFTAFVKNKPRFAWRVFFPIAILTLIVTVIARVNWGKIKMEEDWGNAVKEGYTFVLNGDAVSPDSIDRDNHIGVFVHERNQPVYIEETKTVLLLSGSD